MARDLNQCNFIGRLGRDPETRYMPNGDAATSFSIAVGETWTDKNSGEKKESVEWVRVTAFRQLGEIAGQYLTKGKQVFISGKMKTRKWTDKENIERYTTEIIADQVQFLGGGKGDGDGNGPSQAPARPAQSNPSKPAAATGNGFDDFTDDIPF